MCSNFRRFKRGFFPSAGVELFKRIAQGDDQICFYREHAMILLTSEPSLRDAADVRQRLNVLCYQELLAPVFIGL